MTATLEAPARPEDDDATDDPPETPRPVPAALAPWHDPHPRIGWLITALVTTVAAFTRFWAFGFPPTKNFDEAYYPVEAQELLRFGYEDNRGYMFIVHPPLGKWLIALSEYLWDGSPSQWLTNSVGWRIAPALTGVLSVVVITRTVRRMMRSNLFGGIAGLLLALEGVSLVLARTAILDIFLQFFVLAGFAALVVDRDKMRARLAGLIADGADLSGGVPSLGPRPWRLVAGVMIGCASAVKWTAPIFMVAFAVLSVLWDRAAFKSAGVRRTIGPTALRSALPALGSLVVTPVATYLLTWLGWFAGENSWNRHWADTHGTSAKLFGAIPFDWGWVPGPLRSLGAYHLDAYRFHQSLDSGHAYASNPWSWWVLGRPVDFYYVGSSFPTAKASPCGSTSCSREVLLIGTPLMWWAFAPMVLWIAWHWLTTRDWRAATVLVAVAAGWLFWFQNLARTMFLFYMAPLIPFLIMGLVLALGVMLGPALQPDDDPDRAWRARRRRQWGIAGISTYLALVIADFAWMWPIFTGGLLTYGQWHAHMWLPSWV